MRAASCIASVRIRSRSARAASPRCPPPDEPRPRPRPRRRGLRLPPGRGCRPARSPAPRRARRVGCVPPRRRGGGFLTEPRGCGLGPGHFGAGGEAGLAQRGDGGTPQLLGRLAPPPARFVSSRLPCVELMVRQRYCLHRSDAPERPGTSAGPSSPTARPAPGAPYCGPMRRIHSRSHDRRARRARPAPLLDRGRVRRGDCVWLAGGSRNRRTGRRTHRTERSRRRARARRNGRLAAREPTGARATRRLHRERRVARSWRGWTPSSCARVVVPGHRRPVRIAVGRSGRSVAAAVPRRRVQRRVQGR